MKPGRIKVALLCGGTSPEHEVSLSSGETAATALDADRYDLVIIGIRKYGDWMIPETYLDHRRTPADIATYFDLYRSGMDKPIDGIRQVPIERVLLILREMSPDVVLILLHGKGGEDGVIQGFLEYGGLCYTGPGVLASALAMDKIRCLRLLASRNFLVPPYVFRLEMPPQPDFSSFIRMAERKFGYPCFVKPAQVGSSVGMSVAKNREELENSLQIARQYDSQILIEEFIQGTEVTCGVVDQVLENGREKRLIFPPTEIVVKGANFFDYQSKYTPGLTEEITPARLPQELIHHLQDTAGDIYQLIGCTGMARIDMIIRQGEIYTLECNTIPGMTPTSLLPQGAAAAGIDFTKLLDIILNHALFTRPGRVSPYA